MHFRTLSIKPIPERLLDPDSRDFRPGLAAYQKGGCYLTQDGDDITGSTVAWACIDILSRDVFTVRGAAVPPDRIDGPLVRTNLFRKDVGWRWEGAIHDIDILVSIEAKGTHHYTIKATFDSPLTLSRFPDRKTEPRLRPTTRGNVELGEVLGFVSIRARQPVPVYREIVVSLNCRQRATSSQQGG